MVTAEGGHALAGRLADRDGRPHPAPGPALPRERYGPGRARHRRRHRASDGSVTATPAPRGPGNVTCRDADVVITGWSGGPIPWPRCRRPGTHGGGSGLLEV